MPMTPEEQKAVDDLQTAAKKMHDLADQMEAERKKFGDVSGELKGAQEKINQRIDGLETKLARPPEGKGNTEDDTVKAKKAKDVFFSLLRKGDNALKSLTPEEVKSFISADDPNGGYTLPPAVRGSIIELAQHLSPVRGLASVETINGTEWTCPRELTLLESDEKGETEAPVETGTESDGDWFGLERIVTHEMYASPYISQNLLDDSEYDLESFATNRISRAFGKKEADWFVNGNGSSQAEGLLVNTSILDAHNGHATVLQADGLIAYVYALHEYYEKTASMIMRRATLGLVRAMKDSVTGTYIWQPAFGAGEPSTILGYPVYACADMPAVGSGTYPILFGDFKAGYKIIDRKVMTILRNPYSHKPYIQLYATRRLGGQVVDPNAFIKLHMAT